MQTPPDPRIAKLSYSSLLTLHSCPRKFQLNRLNSRQEDSEDWEASVTFAFGHVVGLGIQSTLQNKSYNQIILEMFLMWDCDIMASNPRQNKSFFHAILAIDKFISLRESGYLKGYRLVQYEGVDAVELGFKISFPDSYYYRGFVDAVLQHEDTGEVVVLEVKTTSSKDLNPATYKNSAQAIGYSIVLDVIFPALSSYKVIYLVYKTQLYEYEQLPFIKSYLQRALWIRELMLDIETIKMYEEAGVYPMRGESCYNFYRECEYLNLCTISTEALTEPYIPPSTEESFQINLTLADLINSQLSKVSDETN
jgi:hypothetical protein